MKHARSWTVVFIAAGMIALAAGPASGATAVGPYYANPSWDQTLSADTRFIVLTNMNSDAVLDRETGLVWEKSPSTAGVPWLDAQDHCNKLSKGNRKGWRLPTLQELTSLIDPTQSNPALPAGHPFQNVQTAGGYWSATSWADFLNTPGDVAWGADVGSDGVVGIAIKKTAFNNVLCVRGGQGVDPQ